MPPLLCAYRNGDNGSVLKGGEMYWVTAIPKYKHQEVFDRAAHSNTLRCICSDVSHAEKQKKWRAFGSVTDLRRHTRSRLETSWRVICGSEGGFWSWNVWSLKQTCHTFRVIFFLILANHVRAAGCPWVNMQWRRHVIGLAFSFVFVVTYFTNKVS